MVRLEPVEDPEDPNYGGEHLVPCMEPGEKPDLDREGGALIVALSADGPCGPALLDGLANVFQKAMARGFFQGYRMRVNVETFVDDDGMPAIDLRALRMGIAELAKMQ